MKLTINDSRYVHLTGADGVAGQTIGRLRDDVDIELARCSLPHINRDIIEPLRGQHNAAERRRLAAREALSSVLEDGRSGAIANDRGGLDRVATKR